MILPRLIRLRDAPAYLGMDRNRFNTEVRPYLTVIPIGKQGVGFDRLDLDQWFEEYKASNGRPALKGGQKPWRKGKHGASSSGAKSGTSTKDATVVEFQKAVERATLKRRKDT